MSVETFCGNLAGRFSRNDTTPSRTSADAPRDIDAASNRPCAPPSDDPCRDRATSSDGSARPTPARCCRRSRARSHGARQQRPAATTSLTRRPAQRFLRVEHPAGETPVQRLRDADDARQEPARRRFRHDAAAENTKPKRAVSRAMRMSMASCIVAPMPTAGPFTAAITGLRHSKISSVTRPPPSRMRSSPQSTLSSDRHCARRGRLRRRRRFRRPRTDRRRRRSARPGAGHDDARGRRRPCWHSGKASIISRIIVAVKALSFSGRLSVRVRMSSSTW